jgi:hypothetical protein
MILKDEMKNSKWKIEKFSMRFFGCFRAFFGGNVEVFSFEVTSRLMTHLFISKYMFYELKFQINPITFFLVKCVNSEMTEASRIFDSEMTEWDLNSF